VPVEWLTYLYKDVSSSSGRKSDYFEALWQRAHHFEHGSASENATTIGGVLGIQSTTQFFIESFMKV
jgi:hypothetical protein